MVERLTSLRADVDFQSNVYRDLYCMGRLVNAVQVVKHRVGLTSALSSVAYHSHGQTPLMAAMAKS